MYPKTLGFFIKTALDIITKKIHISNKVPIFLL